MLGIDYNLLVFGLSLTLLVHDGEGTCKKDKNNDHLVIEPIVGRFVHSEGPHWDHRAQKLYFVDIEEQKIYMFDPTTKDLTYIYIKNGPVGVAVPVDGDRNKFVAGSAQDFILVNWESYKNVSSAAPEILAHVDQNRNGTRWNDGKVDSSGRFWGGTIGPEVNDVVVPNQASFYRIDSDLKPKVELSPVTNSNGLAWNIEDDTLYYIDTPTLQVAKFDYEPINGTISNKRIAFDLQKNNISGFPDGMTIDRDGNLWVALYNGGGVVNVNPHTGKVIRSVELPVKKVTSVAFGGTNLNTLFVTTSSRDLTQEELAEQPHAGYVFAIHHLGVRGLIANSFIL